MSQYSVEDFAQFLKNAKEESEPYVLFTGAGCSLSAGIPLADELVEEINDKYSFAVKSLSEEDKKDYGKCMAVIGKNARRKLLSEYISEAKLNWAHLIIAHLMNEGYINKVLTFNFDNLLARSCGLLGLYPATYDLTTANLDLHHLIVEPAIVHLHGQSHGFYQLNSDDETSNQSEVLSDFISATLNASPALFIGYSGNADAFFPQLCKKYNGQHHLFWSGRDEAASTTISQKLLNMHTTANYLQAKDADIFFIDLAKALGCFPPPIFINPHGHLLEELEDVLPLPMVESSGSDSKGKDILVSVKERLRNDIKNNDNALIDTDKLLLEGHYDKLIQLAESTDHNKLNDNDRDNIAWAYINQGLALYRLLAKEDDVEKSVTYLIEEGEKYEQAIAIKPDKHQALYNWAITLVNLSAKVDDKVQSIMYLKEACEKYEQAIVIKPDKHQAFYNWGITLVNLSDKVDDKTQSITYLKESCDKYEQAIAIKPDKDEALYNWGIALSKLSAKEDDRAQSVRYLKEACEKYEQAIVIKPDIYETLYNWGITLTRLAGKEYDKAQSVIYLTQACEKYAQAIEFKPDEREVLNIWGVALAELAKKVDDKAQSLNYLEKAKNVLLKAEKLNSDGVYNLACVYALMGEYDECRTKLTVCRAANTLLSKEDLSSDDDLNAVRHFNWFKELVEGVIS